MDFELLTCLLKFIEHFPDYAIRYCRVRFYAFQLDNLSRNSCITAMIYHLFKFDCVVEEMLYIRMRKPTLNVQTVPSAPRCLFRPFILIYAYFVAFPDLHAI